jgi:hypothetical protein
MIAIFRFKAGMIQALLACSAAEWPDHPTAGPSVSAGG